MDLVYNRLTDFYLERDTHAPLLRAYDAGGVVVTPHPRAYATYADKSLLTLFSDGAWLARHGVPDDVRATLLAGIPKTETLDAASRARLWGERSAMYFKPVRGFGSSNVHRGDDLTEATWSEMRDGEYVAQRLVPAGERTIAAFDRPLVLKVDIRVFAYDGNVQLVGARLYQGATTNLRTPGGGFALVYANDEPSGATPRACWEACPIARAKGDIEGR